MSAYIVDRDHILYLVEAAMHYVDLRHCSLYFGNPSQKLNQGHDCEQAEVIANMLWMENIRSVSHRYPNESSGTLPGPIKENFVFTSKDFEDTLWLKFDVAQVLKACDCYTYQSCEHPQWEQTNAYSFIEALRSCAWHSMPGYDAAEWGAPAAQGNYATL